MFTTLNLGSKFIMLNENTFNEITRETVISVHFKQSELIALADNMMYAADMAEKTMPFLARNLRKKAYDFYSYAGMNKEIEGVIDD